MRGLVPALGILLLMISAYWHSSQVSNLYDQRMHQDIQSFTQELTREGLPSGQIKAFRSALLDVNRHTLGLVTSEVFNIVGTFSTMGIVIMVFSLAMAGRIENRKKEDERSS